MRTFLWAAGVAAFAPLVPAQSVAASPPIALLETGAGYAAKVIGSAVFVSGRSVASVLAEEFAPDTPIEAALRPLLRVEVDEAARALTVHAGGVQRTAVFRPGLGCTLALGIEPEDLARQTVPLPAYDRAPDPRPWPAGDALPHEPWPEGVDAKALRAAVDDAFADDGPRPVRTRAVVVVFDGRLLYERYAEGFDATMPLPGWSMAKSVVGALVGIRVRQGVIALDDPVPIAAWKGEGDPRAALTWRVLLQMSSGLAWQESYVDPAGDVPRMLFAEPAAGDFAAARPLQVEPGTRYRYSSGTTNVLCRALRATFEEGADYLTFPSRELFARIGMRSAVLEPDASGVFVGSSFLLATARDWARFGLLYLGDGVWQGERILPEGFVEESTTPAPAAPRGRYGLHWWLNAGPPGHPEQRAAPGLPADMFAANGFQGQTLVVIPSRRLVVVRLGCTKNERDFDAHAMVAASSRRCREPRASRAFPSRLMHPMQTDPRYPIGPFDPPTTVTPELRAGWIDAIRATPDALRASVAGLSDAQLDTPYRDGGWTVRQVVHHLADSHLHAYCRTKYALTEERPAVKAYDENTWAALPDSSLPVAPSLALLGGVHERWVAVLASLRAEDFARAWFHPERGKTFDLDFLLALYAWHGRHHVAHVTELRARRGW
ncbi:MAG TPA: putative metal-dependent hydrolase [Planctomycetota bacterium]|nr:putative metal-dependent hydrolase [Planctomycetota bacterium]